MNLPEPLLPWLCMETPFSTVEVLLICKLLDPIRTESLLSMLIIVLLALLLLLLKPFWCESKYPWLVPYAKLFDDGCCLADKDTVEFLLDLILIFGMYPICSSLTIGYGDGDDTDTLEDLEDALDRLKGGDLLTEFFLYLIFLSVVAMF